MQDCVFCNILNNVERKNSSKEDEILYEDDLIAVIPAKGAPVAGWILLVVKKHINGFAELTSKELIHANNIINIIKHIYKEYFGINSILLEHGSTINGRHPQSITHAHIHLIPFNFNEDVELELLEKLKLSQIESLQFISINQKQDYWLYCNPTGKFYTSCKIMDVPRSIFMNLVAKQCNITLPYEWRTITTNEKFLNEMIYIFRNNIDKFNNMLKS